MRGGAEFPRRTFAEGEIIVAEGWKEITQSVDAIKKDRQPAVDGAEGRKSIEIILAVYKAAESGKAVKLPLAKDPPLQARKRTKGKI
mgnify:CR=1 FL=1